MIENVLERYLEKASYFDVRRLKKEYSYYAEADKNILDVWYSVFMNSERLRKVGEMSAVELTLQLGKWLIMRKERRWEKLNSGG